MLQFCFVVAIFWHFMAHYDIFCIFFSLFCLFGKNLVCEICWSFSISALDTALADLDTALSALDTALSALDTALAAPLPLIRGRMMTVGAVGQQ